jgi:ADP-ribose pyrophosphatase
VLLANGREASREIVKHPGGVTVLPLTEDGDVILVRQYRYAFEEVLLEVPAGKLESDEEPLHCARRELREETGYSADKITYLGAIYPSPGFCDEVLYLYLAQDLRQGKACPDEDEILAVDRMPFSQLVDLVMEDRVRDAKTVAAVLKAKYYLESG